MQLTKLLATCNYISNETSSGCGLTYLIGLLEDKCLNRFLCTVACRVLYTFCSYPRRDITMSLGITANVINRLSPMIYSGFVHVKCKAGDNVLMHVTRLSAVKNVALFVQYLQSQTAWRAWRRKGQLNCCCVYCWLIIENKTMWLSHH